MIADSACQIRSDQIRSDQIRSGEVKSGEVTCSMLSNTGMSSASTRAVPPMLSASKKEKHHVYITWRTRSFLIKGAC